MARAFEPERTYSPELAEAIDNCVKNILEYESDTFSAQGETLTEVDAEHVLAQLIYLLIFDKNGMPGALIDGCTIGNALDVFREGE